MNIIFTKGEKTVGGETNFVLLKVVGKPQLFSNISEEMLGRAWVSIIS